MVDSSTSIATSPPDFTGALQPGDAVGNPIIFQRHPFTSPETRFEVQQGKTILELMALSGITPNIVRQVQCFIGDDEIPQNLWKKVRPKAGVSVTLRLRPGKDDSSQKAVRVIAMIVIAVVAWYVVGPYVASGFGLTAGTPAYGLVSGLAASAFIGVGTLALNALIPPIKQEFSTGDPYANLTGTRNAATPYGPIPRMFGRRRMYPVYIGRPYTESVDNQQYMRLLLCCGYGPLKMSDLKFGETPVENLSGVNIEFREGWADDEGITLYSKDIQEDSFLLRMYRNEPKVRTSRANIDEISVELTFLAGLFFTDDDDGRKKFRDMRYEVRYRPVGTTTWLVPKWEGSEPGQETNGILLCSDISPNIVRRSGRWKVDRGQYDVQITQLTPNNPDARYSDICHWTALRSVVNGGSTVNMKGLAVLAMRIKASDQLNGVPDIINVLAESYLPVHDGTKWSWQISRNPAWAFADVFRRRGLVTVAEDNRLDLAEIRAWAAECDELDPVTGHPRWTFDGVINGGSIYNAAKAIAATGRGAFSMKDGLYSVVRDKQQTVPIQHITPRNSWNYQGVKAFVEKPHALRCRFPDEDNGYQDQELVVYWDGYGPGNARKFEVLDMPYTTRSEQVFRDARYFMAVMELRPEIHSVTMDVEAIRCTQGDLVRFAHDVISVGLAQGRIAAINLNGGGNIASLVLDETVEFEAVKSYGIRVQTGTGLSVVMPLSVIPGPTNVATLATPISPVGGPEVGNLFLLGESALESAPMIVKEVRPKADLQADIMMVDAQPGVYTADTGPIPPFQNYITHASPLSSRSPLPVTFSLVSDERALSRQQDGTLLCRIAVQLDPLLPYDIPVAAYELEWRPYDPVGYAPWRKAAGGRIGTSVLYIDGVDQGEAYDVRVRTTSAIGSTVSTWNTVTNHVVVGKTTPPQNVAGFSATPLADRVQLTWTDNITAYPFDIDVAGYEVRRGASWSEATLVQQVNAATTTVDYFTSSTAPETFLIKAIDTVGLYSIDPAVATGAVTVPDNVAGFEVYPANDDVRFVWTPVSGVSVYEIRSGVSWDLGRVVCRPAGDTITVKWPIQTAEDSSFWIKAISPAALYSVSAYFASAAQAPISNRNVIAATDFSTGDFAGVKLDLTQSGSGTGAILVLDQDGGGINRRSGDYYATVDLTQTFYARNWLEQRVNAVAGAGLTWDEATFTWDSATTAAWEGQFSDAVGAQLFSWISMRPAAVPSDIVEGWRLNGTTTGINGTTANTTTGITYADARLSTGAVVGHGDALDWLVSVPETFSTTFDVRPDNTAGDFTLLRLEGAGGIWLEALFDSGASCIALQDSAGVRLEVPWSAWENQDVVTIGVSQSTTDRAIFAASRRYPTPQSATGALAPLGAFTKVRLHSAA